MRIHLPLLSTLTSHIRGTHTSTGSSQAQRGILHTDTMKVSTFPNNLVVPTLIKRRQRATIHKILLTITVGLLTYCCINTFMSIQATQAIPVTSRTVHQGEALHPQDIRYIRLPAIAGLSPKFFITANSAHLRATTTLPEGTPLLAHLTDRTPHIPHGFTTISIRLSSSTQHLAIGERVDLAYSNTNSETPPHEPLSNNSSQDHQHTKPTSATHSDEDEEQLTLVIIHNAIVVSHERAENEDTLDGKLIGHDHETLNVMMAMPAEDALRLLNAQTNTPHLAIITIKQ